MPFSLRYGNRDFADYICIELYLKDINAERANGKIERDFAAVNLDFVLFFERFGNVLYGYGAVRSAVCTALNLYIYRYVFELFGNILRRLLFKLYAVALCIFLALHFRKNLVICGNGKLFREKEIVCISVGYVYNLTFFALTFYICKKYNFHFLYLLNYALRQICRVFILVLEYSNIY